MKKLVILSTSTCFVFIMGCTHTVAVRPTLDVTATIANQLDFKVGLFMPPEVKGLQIGDRASWSDKYIFKEEPNTRPIELRPRPRT